MVDKDNNVTIHIVSRTFNKYSRIIIIHTFIVELILNFVFL